MNLLKSPLFRSIFVWVITFGFLFWLVGALLTGEMSWMRVNSPTESDEFFGLTTTALAILGGILAIGYLVIRYRERAAAEREEEAAEREEEARESQQIDQDFRLAIEQLGHDKPVVRIAGVHALIAISDQYGGGFNQRTVDVLCGYLRADRTDIDDRAVESTILQSIQKRTAFKDSEGGPWSACRFDFHGTTFSEELNFTHLVFYKEVDFAGATFQQAVRLDFSGFGPGLDFSESTFYKTFDASSAVFNETVDFTNAVFRDEAVFKGTEFYKDAAFDQASFWKPPFFDGATFSPSVGMSPDDLPTGAEFRES